MPSRSYDGLTRGHGSQYSANFSSANPVLVVTALQTEALGLDCSTESDELRAPRLPHPAGQKPTLIILRWLCFSVLASSLVLTWPLLEGPFRGDSTFPFPHRSPDPYQISKYLGTPHCTLHCSVLATRVCRSYYIPYIFCLSAPTSCPGFMSGPSLYHPVSRRLPFGRHLPTPDS